MANLKRTLHDSDSALLPILAKVWGVNIQKLDGDEIIGALVDAMTDPARTERVWAGLDDKQRGALQTLIASGSGQMPKAMFERLFGEIRKMGAAQIEREKPHQSPVSVAEALYYRGLIGETFQLADSGARIVVYVPDDLMGALPTHKTAYENLDDEGELPDDEDGDTVTGVVPLAEVTNPHQADTSIVDDLTTLLAYMQLFPPLLDGDSLGAAEYDALAPYLLKPDAARVSFMLGVAMGADLVEIQAGRAYPKRAEARRWLSATRAEQVRKLAEAWRDSPFYRDLWHVPGLYPETGGLLDSYDPAVARHAMIGFLTDLAPRQEWWSIESFIAAVKETDPDFQRPGGDYDSWYIRSEAGDFLRGFESWDAVEGALLEFYLLSPLHWLGLVDLADDAARLNAYGRAFVGAVQWVTQPDPPSKMTIKDDGLLSIPRAASRLDRFQVARFTTWGKAGDPYTYKLDAMGLQRGAEQGIDVGHISGFIAKATDAPLPAAVTKMLDNWRAGAQATVTFEQLLVLRTTAPETLDAIFEKPALRRYLGAKLGPMAVIVRADQWEALRDVLGREGIKVEVRE